MPGGNGKSRNVDIQKPGEIEFIKCGDIDSLLLRRGVIAIRSFRNEM